MPNWVYNGLTIEGSPAEITRLVEQMNKPFKQLHDSWNMESGKMEKKNTLYPNPVFAFHNIFSNPTINYQSKSKCNSKQMIGIHGMSVTGEPNGM
jgi:hypothetical protein